MTTPSYPRTAAVPADVNYGFIIDNRKCIGCHACSVACKSENEVPLGVSRTWVKYVETGAFPDVRRHFQVTRCNHCANPPCARICPTEAMYQRADGIVEFDPSVCIGCKACMQACPYDAIYIDPETNTAAKCHFCAHRTDVGLEPACVVVCPEHAIIAGNINDPHSEIGKLLATEDVTVRKPEQGTAPNLFYIEGNDVVMHPTATDRTPETFMWADVIPLHADNGQHAKPAPDRSATSVRHTNGTPLRAPQPQGQPWAGPIQFAEGRMAEHMVQVGYNQQHKVPWHWPVPAYLVTKGIGAGLFLLLSLGVGLRWLPADPTLMLTGGFLTLLFIGLTTALLVFDLEQPLRFHYILLRPQWRSWLTRGAFILIGFTIITGLWWLVEGAAALGWLDTGLADSARPIFLGIGFPFAVMSAIYTAFLFAQAEGRDLWQSPLLPFHLVVQSLMAGAAMLAIVDLFVTLPAGAAVVAWTTLLIALLVDLFVLLAGEFGIPHASEVAARAAHDIKHGRYKNYYQLGTLALGHVIPLALLIAAFFTTGIVEAIVAAAAGLAAIAGLYLYEYAFVMAPQDIPNS